MKRGTASPASKPTSELSPGPPLPSRIDVSDGVNKVCDGTGETSIRPSSLVIDASRIQNRGRWGRPDCHIDTDVSKFGLKRSFARSFWNTYAKNV